MMLQERLTETFSWPSDSGWDCLSEVQTAFHPELVPSGEQIDELLTLDEAGWRRLLTARGFSRREVRRLDEVAALWLAQDDYRRLRKLAGSSEPAFAEAEELLVQWLFPGGVERLGCLVAGMGFASPLYPVCYALASALQAARAALGYAGLDRGFSDAEIAEMVAAREATADEDEALAAGRY